MHLVSARDLHYISSHVPKKDMSGKGEIALKKKEVHRLIQKLYINYFETSTKTARALWEKNSGSVSWREGAQECQSTSCQNWLV